MRRSFFPWYFVACSACAPQVITAIDPPDAGQPIDASGGAPPMPDSGLDAQAPDADVVPPEPTLRGDALLHRYSFDGSGMVAMDSKGAAHGALIATQLSGEGLLRLDQTGPNQYVDLPNRLISGLTDATFEVWLTWAGGADWQRIFDFGDSTSMIEDERSSGRSYLFLAPHGNGDFVRAVYKNPMLREVIIDARPALTVGAPTCLAIVFDDTNNLMRLFRDGAKIGEVELDSKLSQIHDVNDWIGRSQFAADAPLSGVIDEFRVYDAALSEAEILKSFSSGPDATL